VLSQTALDHVANPRNAGPLPGATHQGVAGDPGGGPYVLLWFRVEGEVIREASYETYGCPASVACASLTAEILKGRTVAQALSMTPRDLTLLVGGLPEGREHCPALVVQAVKNAFSEENNG
jgi:nitrogen fixation protein NifU and related proteins